MKKDLNIVMNDLRRLTPIDSRSGRIGYIKVCEEGEELRKPEFEIIEYETDKDCIQLDC